jgi:hypothetical protein
MKGHARRLATVAGAALALASAASARTTAPAGPEALGAFETVRQVFQHPRCQNCHIPGDAPLQFDDGRPHGQNVVRGPKGHGPAGQPCATCHGEHNPPASYGAHVPPGAHNWALPPPETRMVFIGLTPAELCATIKDRKQTGGRDLPAMLEHIANDKLVAWGWDPGVGRAPVPIPRERVIAAFRSWMDGGAPCPTR